MRSFSIHSLGKDLKFCFQVHAWVNYGSLLQKCLIGRLVSMAPEVSVEELMFGKAEKMPKPPTKQMAKVCSPIEDSKVSDLQY